MRDRTVPDRIKEQLPIEALISGYIPLKRAGRIYKGLCPFHQEKSPSFTVSPDRGIWKCFGCDRGGDHFSFVMELEGLTFPEAVTLLAEKAGVPLDDWKPERQEGVPSGPSKARLFELNGYVASLWNAVLTRHPLAGPARAYLSGRGVSDQSVMAFRIGYAPDGGGTRAGLSKAGFTAAEIGAAGDPLKFRDRIVFPIADLTGKTVGFTGRLLADRENAPKYWNTPETAVFRKSHALFGLHLAKHAIQDAGHAVLAEGQMDVVALHQAGYPMAVASSGTALTSDQLGMVARFAGTVVFAYDGDGAGIKATLRGIELAWDRELAVEVVRMPPGADPADALKDDPDVWKLAYEGRVPAMRFVIDTVVPEGSKLDAEGKKRAAGELAGWLRLLKSQIVRDEWIPHVALRLGTVERNVRDLIGEMAAAPFADAPPESAPRVDGAADRGDLALAVLLAYPEALPAVAAQLGPLEQLPLSPFRSAALPLLKAEGGPDRAMDALEPEARTALDLQLEEILRPYAEMDTSPSWAVSEAAQLLSRLRADATAAARDRISLELNAAQRVGDLPRVALLFRELQDLVR